MAREWFADTSVGDSLAARLAANQADAEKALRIMQIKAERELGRKGKAEQTLLDRVKGKGK